MKKWLSLTAAMLVSLLPGLQAQEAEEEAPNPDAPAAPAPAGAKDAKAKAGAKDAKGGAKDGKGEQTESKKSEFSAQQQKIKILQDKMKKAKRSSEKRKIRDVLLREQRKLEFLVNRKLKPLQDQISPLKERLRWCEKNHRARLEKELTDLDARIETIKKDADLEKWCAKPDGPVTEPGSAPDLGSGNKVRRGKKKK